jgi:hypothetical protein
MASSIDPPKSSKRATRTRAPEAPVGAQAQALEGRPDNTIVEAPVGETPRTPRERNARESHNTIAAVAPQSRSQTAPGEERSNTASAPRAMPEHIGTRYARVGDEYHFPDGNLAFQDRGTRLTTKLENTEVVRDLIAIAQARGWSIEITGSREFQRRAWQEAQLAGLTVRNYEATELERQALARRLSRERDRTSAATPPTSAAPERRPTGSDPARDPPRTAAPAPAATDRIYRGRLVDHGPDRYQFDPRQEPSYYVVLDTPEQGEQVIWGRDLERAVAQSLSHARAGEDVVVRQLGARPVTVSRPVRDEDGQVVTHREVKTHLNRWLVETDTFLRERAQLAEVVRDVGIDAKKAVAQHPELAGTYGELHAARLVALQQNYRHPADLERFIDRTREAIAQEIERGEPLSPPLTRARYQGELGRSPRAQERSRERTL